jgi:hypothetical protein
MNQYLENYLNFVITKFNLPKADALKLMHACETDFSEEYIPVIVLGRLLQLNPETKPNIKMLVNDIYRDNSQDMLKAICIYAWTNEE